jgi:beta-xylosidase/AraC-like DNA-binding protein
MVDHVTDNYAIRFVNAICDASSQDRCSTLMLVLKGKVAIQTEGVEPQTLSTGDVWFFNQHSPWQLTGDKENIIILIDILPAWLLRQSIDLSGWDIIFDNESAPWHGALIRNQIKQLTRSWLQRNSATWILDATRSLLAIFSILLRHYKRKATTSPAMVVSERISQVINWVNTYYQQRISLNQIASQLHVTTSHLSRQFTQEMGMNFRTWLTNVRFTQAVKQIAFTSMPIGQIITENGFSSIKRFSLLFREQYAMTPGKYREKIKRVPLPAPSNTETSFDKTREINSIDSVELFSLLCRTEPDYISSGYHGAETKTENIHISPLKLGHKFKQQSYIVVVGELEELLKQHIQKQLQILKERVRCFKVEVDDPLLNVFASRSIRTDELTPTWSPWTNSDMAIGFLKNINVTPVIRLAPFNSSIPLNEYLQWLQTFIEHNILLLGNECVDNWTFILEIHHKNKASYDTDAVTISDILSMLRNELPNCHIGIAWGRNSFPVENIPSFISSGLLNYTDFLAISVASDTQYDGVTRLNATPEDNDITLRRQLNETVRTLKRYGVQKPLYLQAWSTVTGNTLRTNGLFFRGALLMETLLSLPEEIQMIGFWLNSRLQNEVTPEVQINTNSLSLFFSATTRRPIFHILALKERLCGDYHSSGEGWIAVCDRNKISILLFNTVIINPLFSIEEHFLDSYHKRFNIKFDIEGNAIWRIKKWFFDQKNGALYYQYGLHPTLFDRDEETMNYISQRSEPTLIVQDEIINKHWIEDVVTDINAVCLIELTKISEIY